MAFGFRHWTARDLLAAWSLYWIGLAVVGARPLVRLYVFASGVPKDHSSVTFGIGDGMVNYVALLDGQRVLGGSISLVALALLIAGPPLALWALWLLGRPRRDALPGVGQPPLLPEQRWRPDRDPVRRDDVRERKEP